MRIPLRTSQSTKRLLVAIPVTVNTNQYAFIAGQNHQRGTHRRLIVIIEAIRQSLWLPVSYAPCLRLSWSYGIHRTKAVCCCRHHYRHSPAR